MFTKMPIGVLFLGVLVINCRTVGTKFTYDKNFEIEKSNRAAILAKFGEPKSRGAVNRNGFSSDYVQYFLRDIWTEEFKELMIEFTDDRVNAYYYQSNMYREESDFDIEKHKKIAIGSSTKDDVIALIGMPYGKLNLPSNFAAPEFVKVAIEKGAKSCFRYAYSGKQGHGYSAILIQKVMIVYFDDTGKVVDIYVSNSGG